VKEVGYNQALNYETIVDLAPDVVFFYGVEGAVNTSAARLEEMGIRVVYCAEYLEAHPLGKAEWLLFFASFYGREEQAAAFFHEVDSAYSAMSDLAASSSEKPVIFTGLPWKDTWYVAGGRSYLASLIRDAGGHYLWEDHPSSEAVAMDIESVYSKALNADIWINPGVAGGLEELRSFDSRYALLPALSAGRVYNNNRRMGPGGGNDYWESGTLRPDLILSDLIAALHPELMPDHQFFYYRQLK
jgi:iron complex transport system substrate-binding protein